MFKKRAGELDLEYQELFLLTPTPSQGSTPLQLLELCKGKELEEREIREQEHQIRENRGQEYQIRESLEQEHQIRESREQKRQERERIENREHQEQDFTEINLQELNDF